MCVCMVILLTHPGCEPNVDGGYVELDVVHVLMLGHSTMEAAISLACVGVHKESREEGAFA